MTAITPSAAVPAGLSTFPWAGRPGGVLAPGVMRAQAAGLHLGGVGWLTVAILALIVVVRAAALFRHYWRGSRVYLTGHRAYIQRHAGRFALTRVPKGEWP